MYLIPYPCLFLYVPSEGQDYSNFPQLAPIQIESLLTSWMCESSQTKNLIKFIQCSLTRTLVSPIPLLHPAPRPVHAAGRGMGEGGAPGPCMGEAAEEGRHASVVQYCIVLYYNVIHRLYNSED